MRRRRRFSPGRKERVKTVNMDEFSHTALGAKAVFGSGRTWVVVIGVLLLGAAGFLIIRYMSCLLYTSDAADE